MEIFRSKTLNCKKIKYVFRDVKWCFNASWGLKGLKLQLLIEVAASNDEKSYVFMNNSHLQNIST